MAALDEEPRPRAPRIGVWPDTSGQTPEETARTIPADAQRARAV